MRRLGFTIILALTLGSLPIDLVAAQFDAPYYELE